MKTFYLLLRLHRGEYEDNYTNNLVGIYTDIEQAKRKYEELPWTYIKTIHTDENGNLNALFKDLGK